VKVCLIIPPSPFLADERVFPFLGILKVAAVLRERGVDVDVLDLSGIANCTEVVTDYLNDNRPDLWGLTATTPQFPNAVKVAETIRRYDYHPIILGGSHATVVGSAYQLDHKRGRIGRGMLAFEQMTGIFDCCVIGDGEEAIVAALSAKPLPPVIDASELNSPFFLQRGTLEQYPFPARDLIDLPSYHYEIDGKPAQSMIAQLGCPMECGFCCGRHTPALRVARFRSIPSVIAEMDSLVKLGYRGIMFYDDEMNINNKACLDLMEAIYRYQVDNRLELRLRGFVKAELFTLEQAHAMYKAGFRIMLSGVESGDDFSLKVMRKHTTAAINTRWLRYSHEAGLKVKALMSIGHPGETIQSVSNSMRWVLENRPDDVDWTIITQYPGSPYFDFSEPHPDKPGVWVYTEPKTGAVLYSQDVNYAEKAEYYKGIPGDYTSHVWTDELSKENLVFAREFAEQSTRPFLGLPPIVAVAAKQFEHSMGMGRLPDSILRSTQKEKSMSPLKKGSADKTRQENIHEMIHSGHPVKQAVAAAYKQQRESKRGEK